ncbi:MAG TPA: hypothetical protein ENG42_01130 [Candidatus Aenigmarchaeota archaeon]|nr:MAG: hypothetical protein DRP03_00600 [Candidatus Aenigmarchaeota archaeon]HDD46053.1 hypothetical protein [Candidatus Aenigmarchaeota archaeon]
MGAFQTLLYNMQRLEFFQFLFPFLLALAIFYGLIKTALGDKLPASAQALISIILAFFVMLYTSWNIMVVDFFAKISGYWLMAGSVLLFILIMFGFVGVKPEEAFGGKSKTIWALVIVFVGILFALGAGVDRLIGIPSWAISSDVWTIIFFIIILAIVVWWMGGEKAEAKGAGEQKPG